MKNLTIMLENRPGSLAEMAETLGAANVSIAGGGMFVVQNEGIANFLVEDGTAARRALDAANIRIIREDEVVIQKLNQDEPGQLGKLLRRMALAGVNVLTQYSDHNHQLVLVVDNLPNAQAVSDAWMKERLEIPEPNGPAAVMKKRIHHYAVRVLWTGNKGPGTASYTSYGRDHEVSAAGKDTIFSSSDPVFRGDQTRYNPEELLVASTASCHMLSYLHLCAMSGIVVLSYADEPTGEMEVSMRGPGAFTRVDLHPVVTITGESDMKLADALHEEAHKSCFIANSLKVPVVVHPIVKTADNQ